MRNKEAGQKAPGIFALEAQGLCSELHQSDAEKKRPSQGFVPVQLEMEKAFPR
jgi:hypothetical protein